MSSLLEKLRTKKLCAEHDLRLRIIEAEDYSGVMRKVRETLAEEGISATCDYLWRGVQSLKLYYAVALFDPANAHAISDTLDPFWHGHILHSRQYMSFCQRVMGEYMHHVPLDRQNRAQLENARTLYGYTIETLNSLFHEVDRLFWPETLDSGRLICVHFGNSVTYMDVQPFRLFEPNSRGVQYAFDLT